MAGDRGFTLIEMLLSVAIIVVLAGLSLPVYFNAQSRNDTASTAETIADALRRAETYARANDSDTQWGVNFQSSGVTLFSGTSYATRVTTNDEPLSIPANMTVSYTGDILFAKFSGVPAATPTITLTSSTGDTANVTINAKGMVNY